MPDIFYFILMVFAGALAALQPIINSNLSTRVGLIESAFISFAVGTVALGAVVLTLRQGDIRGALGAPWWQLSGGLLGALFVTAVIMSVTRIGTTAALTAAIAAQLGAGLLLDHFGLLGGRQIPADFWRVFGVVLLFVGSALVLKG